MAGVKTVTLPEQFTRPLAESVENAIGDIEQPGAEGEKQRRDKRQAEMHGASEEPRPKGSNSWRIQAEQMPPFRKIVAATDQDPVYFAAAPRLLNVPRVRPMVGASPEFPVEVGGVVELHAAFLKRKPHTRSCLMPRNRKSGYAGANVGHPFVTRLVTRPTSVGRPQQMQISHLEAGQQRDHDRPGAGSAPLCAASAWPRRAT
jgi:hypothetical protein